MRCRLEVGVDIRVGTSVDIRVRKASVKEIFGQMGLAVAERGRGTPTQRDEDREREAESKCSGDIHGSPYEQRAYQTMTVWLFIVGNVNVV